MEESKEDSQRVLEEEHETKDEIEVKLLEEISLEDDAPLRSKEKEAVPTPKWKTFISKTWFIFAMAIGGTPLTFS
jgi:hypothetical protein